MTVSVSVAGVGLLARLSILMWVGLGVQPAPGGPHTGARPIHVDGYVSGVVVKLSVGSGLYCTSPESWEWGFEGECPRSVLSDVRVTWRNLVLHTPRSAFADLGEPHEAQVTAVGRGFDLKVTGGDAAVGYSAVLE
jgi:hypothetical protein